MKLRRFSVNYAILSIALDILSTALAFSLAISLRSNLEGVPFTSPLSDLVMPSTMLVIVPLLWVTTLLITSIYKPRRSYKATDEFRHVIVGVSISTLVFAALLYLFFPDFSRREFLLFVSIDLTLLLTWRSAARVFWRRTNLLVTDQRVLIIGPSEMGQRGFNIILEHRYMGLAFVGYFDDDLGKEETNTHIVGGVKDSRNVMSDQKIDDVVITLPQHAHRQVSELLMALHNFPVNFRVMPNYFSLALNRVTLDYFGGSPF